MYVKNLRRGGDNFLTKSEKAHMPMQEFDVFDLCEYHTTSFFMVRLDDLKVFSNLNDFMILFYKITAFKSLQKRYNIGVRNYILQDSNGKSGPLSRE